MSVYVQCNDCGGVTQLSHWAFPSGWTGATLQGNLLGDHHCPNCKDAGDKGYRAAIDARRANKRAQIEIG